MVKNRRANKSVILAAAIVALTATYLLVTGAMAQAEKGVAKDSGVEYTRDRLSYGDIWAFDYAKTKYAESEIDSKATEWGKYTTLDDGITFIDNNVIKDTIAYDNLYRFYLDPTTCEPTYNQYDEWDAVYQWKTDRSVIAGSPVHTGKGESLFFSGNTSANVPGTEGVSINTVKSEEGNARYTVVPNNGGDYTVYVYSETKNPVLRCAVLDTGAKYNEFANGGGQMRENKDAISLTQIGNTSWYKGTIHVDNTHWSAYTVTCKTSWNGEGGVTAKNIKDKESSNSSTSLVLAEKAPTGRAYGDRGNQWESTEVWFDTLLVFEFDSNTQLGPITQKGQLTIRSGNDGGTMTAKNVFGETVEVGKSTTTEHADIVITPAPKSGFKFAGFKDGAAKAIPDSNNYVYSFRADNTITGLWLQEGLNLPTMTVTRTKADGTADESFGAKPLNFISDSKLTESTKCTESFTYTIAINWAGVTTEGVTYTCQVNGGETKTITSVDTTITLENVRWDTQKVTFTAKPKKGVAQEAVFTAQVDNHVGNTATAPADCVASIGRNHYYYLEDALLEAKNGDKVILAKDAGFAEEVGRSAWTEENAGYTVKEGVTLLVPFDEDKTTITDPNDENLYSATQHWASTGGFEAYRTLTLASGKTLSVQGTLVVGGRWASANGGSNASIIPPYGLIQMEENSHISVENGGKLYAWGYISRAISDDRTQDVGDVTVKNGGTVYEIFQIQDFRGGWQSVAIALGSERVFPFSQYYVQNIEVPLTLQAGAKETAATALFADNKVNAASFTMIGGKTEGLFRLTSKGASLKRTYDPSKDRMTYAMNGSTEINSIQMSLAGNPVDSSNYYLPINSGISVKVESGTTTIAGDIALLPGVEVTVDDNATLAVAEEKTLFVYDADEWVNKGYVGNGGNKDMAAAPYSVANGTTAVRKNESLVDAAVTVNGTLKADGNVCTSASGANITCGENGQLNIGANGIQTSAILQAKAGEKIGTPNTPAQLNNGDGTYTQTTNLTNATLRKGSENGYTKTNQDGNTEAVVVSLQIGTNGTKMLFYSYADAIAGITTEEKSVLTALADSKENLLVEDDYLNNMIFRNVALDMSNYTMSGNIVNKTNLTINNGKFTGTITNEKGTLSIIDGIFTGLVSNALGSNLMISGGTFDNITNNGIVKAIPYDTVKIKQFNGSGESLVDRENLPLKLTETSDKNGYYSLTSNTVTVTFDCNGQKGDVMVAEGDAQTRKISLAGNTVYEYPFTKKLPGYAFLGWNNDRAAETAQIEADAKGVATLTPQNLAGAGAKAGEALSLYAIYDAGKTQYQVIWAAKDKMNEAVKTEPTQVLVNKGEEATATLQSPKGYVIVACDYAGEKIGIGPNADRDISLGWEGITITGISDNVTVGLTLQKYDHKVTWKVKESNKNGTEINTDEVHYVVNKAHDSWTAPDGFRIPSEPKSSNRNITATKSDDDRCITITGRNGVSKDVTITVETRNYSNHIQWRVNGNILPKTYLESQASVGQYTVTDENMVIAKLQVIPGNGFTKIQGNRSVKFTNVTNDIVVNITLAEPTTNATYYMGEMSFQYCKSMAVFTNDGWKMLDNYTWRHKTGSVTHEVGENTYTVANGDILLVNDSNQVYAYTIKLAEKGVGFDWAHMEFLLDGKAVVGQDEIKVVVQPGKKATVTAKMVGDTDKLDMKDQPLGKIKVEMQPAE